MKYLIYTAIIISTLSSCIKDNTDCPKEFELPGNVIPYDSVYHIGDTISLISKFSKNVTEVNNHNKYKLEDIIWEFSFRAFRIDSGKTAEDALSTRTDKCFNIINCNDTNYYWDYFSDGGSYLMATTKFDTDTYRLILDISPKVKGIYMIGFGSSTYESYQDFEGKCKGVPFSAHAINNKGKDNNIYLLEESPMPHFNNWILQEPEERFYPFFFAFRVID